MEPAIKLSNNNLASLINNIQKTQLSLTDWQSEKLNFVPLRGSWFANSEADFDLEAEINKFLLPQNNKKVMLLMGDSGAGKSLYTQGLVNKLWQNFSAQSLIPIWISLPSLKDPVNRAIEETFEKYGFNKDQIEELRKTRSFIFILDAYDEIRCEKNLYQTNNLDKWNAKIIFTCRREYLYHKDNYKLFFAPFIGDKIQYSQYEEIYIRPFNVNQIKTFVQQYIKTQKTNWDNPERYQKAIEEIPGLKELIKTPFILKLAIEVLPQIVERYATQNIHECKKITQAALYDVFIEQWFIRQEQKLKEAKQIKKDEDIKPEFWAYAKELAMEMHKTNLTQVVYNANEESDLFSAEVKENSWAKFFTPKNPRIEMLRTSCLVRETSPHHYAFIHLSLLEYFLTRNLYEKIIAQNSNTQISFLSNSRTDLQSSATASTSVRTTAVTSVIVSQNAPSNQINTSAKEDYFNQHLMVKENNTLQFLADRVAEQEVFKKSLFDRVYTSRNNPLNQVAAANAITILNKAKVKFSDLDLSNIHIAQADLSYSHCQNTNFSESNLSQVNFIQAYLQKANLCGCNLKDIELGQLSYLQHDKNIKCCCYTKKGDFLAVAFGTEITIWNSITRQETMKLKGHFDVVQSIIYTSDDKLLISGCADGLIYLWDIATKKLVTILENHLRGITCLVLNDNNSLMASCSNDRNVCIWDLAKKQLITKFEHPKISDNDEHKIYSLHFFEKSELLACKSDKGNIFFWKMSDRKIQFSLPAKQSNKSAGYNHIALHPTSKSLVNVANNQIEIWDLTTKKLVGNLLTGHTDVINSIVFSPDGKILASASKDKTLRFWDIEKMLPIGAPLAGHLSDVVALAFSPDGQVLASASFDNTVHLWDLKNLGLMNSLIATQQININNVLGLNAENLNISNAEGLSANNLLLLNQLGAVGRIPESQSEQVKLADCLYKNGIVQIELKNYANAIKLLQEAIKLSSNNPDYNAALALTLYHVKNYDAAINAYDNAIKLKNNYAEYYFKRALLKLELRRFDDVIKDLNQAIQCDAKEAKYYHCRGQAKMSLQLNKEAIEDFDSAINLDPNDLHIQADRWKACQAMNRNEKLDIDPIFLDKFLNQQRNYFDDKDDPHQLSELLTYLHNENVQIRKVGLNGFSKSYLGKNISSAKVLEAVWREWGLIDKCDKNTLMYFLVSFDTNHFLERQDTLILIMNYFVCGDQEKFQFSRNLLCMFPRVRKVILETCKRNVNSSNTIVKQNAVAIIQQYYWLFRDTVSNELLTTVPSEILKKVTRYLATVYSQNNFSSFSGSGGKEVKIYCPFSRGVGNYCTVVRYMQGYWRKSHDPIVEESLRKTVNVDNVPHLLDILVSAGQEEFADFRAAIMRESTVDAVVMVYDITRKNSFLNCLDDDLQLIHKNNKYGKYMPKIVVGNKVDLPDERQISKNEALYMAIQRGLPYIESSAKANYNVNTIFETLIRFTHLDKEIKAIMSSFYLEIKNTKDKSVTKELMLHELNLPSASSSLFKVSSTASKDDKKNAPNEKEQEHKDDKEKCCTM